MTLTTTIREWGNLPIGQDGVSQQAAERLLALADRATKRLRTPQRVLSRSGTSRLQAGQVVGVLSVPSACVEILPKIGPAGEPSVRRALTHMLAVAHALPVADAEPAALETQRENLPEILIRSFATRLLAAVRRGLPHRYRLVEDDLRLLRGKLDVRRQLTRHAVSRELLACRYDELSVDTPLNRVLKAAVKRLRSATSSAPNARRLDELTARFDLVGDSPNPLRERVRLDRTNSTFHRLHRIARLLLAGDWQSTTTGGNEGFALLFPMNQLFEEFIGRSMKRALSPRSVRLQARGRYALNADRGQVFALQPDIVVDEDIVVDAKWKSLMPGETTVGVEQSDVYQMLAYERAYRARRLVLVYPWYEGLAAPGVFKRWHVPETRTAFEVVTVDIGAPQSVRSLLQETLGDPTRDGEIVELETSFPEQL